MTKKTKEAKLQRHRTDKIIRRRQKDPNEIQKGQKVTQCGKQDFKRQKQETQNDKRHTKRNRDAK